MIKIKHKLDSRDTKEKIIELFFTKHLKTVDIAKKLKVGMPYITKIIQKDSRYIREKENKEIKINIAKKTKNWYNICNRTKENIMPWERMQ